MKSKSLHRVFLLASGLCAVTVILLSQAFYKGNPDPKAKAEKAKDKSEVLIHAPSDMTVQGQAVELDHSQPALLEELSLSDDKNEKAAFIQRTATDFFKTLFRVIISPNAP
jgi:hypothetical protein